MIANSATALDDLAVQARRLSSVSTRLLRVVHYRRLQLSYHGAVDDLFIVSFPKSGTTLMQMLVHQLMTDGEVSFSHIREFSPFLEVDMVTARQPGKNPIDAWPPPRVIKSHLNYSFVPKGPGRYIYVMRNGLDVCVSFYHQYVRGGWTQPFQFFFSAMMEGALPVGCWFDHVRSWLLNERNLNVLYVTYEELRADFHGVAQRVAAFCGLQVPPSEWPRIASHCSFQFMREHEDKFDETSLKRVSGTQHRFLRCGIVGGWRSAMTPAMLAYYQTKYDRAFDGLQVPSCLRGNGAR